MLSGAKVTLDLLGKASGPNLKAFADHLVTRLPDERIDPDKVVAAIGRATANAKPWGDWNSIKSTVLGTVPPVDENLGKP